MPPKQEGQLKLDNAPLHELVFGIGFERLKALKAPHVGLFWDTFRKDFPQVQHAPPIAPPTPEGLSGFIEEETGFPLPRFWFIHADENLLLQLQQDRLLLNWRKSGKRPYPHFSEMLPQFLSFFSNFRKFIEGQSLGIITPTELELNYVNQIGLGREIKNPSEIGRIFPSLKWVVQRPDYLKTPKLINYQLGFDTLEKDTVLTVKVLSGKTPERKEVVVFEFSEKKTAAKISIDSIEPWYKAAHVSIVDCFKNLIDEGIQKDYWKRKN
jgi:uncharacterized protein (TIGR04255 family)